MDITPEGPVLQLETTEDALFAEMGRLYFKNQLLHRRVAQQQAVIETLTRQGDKLPEEEDGDAVGES